MRRSHVPALLALSLLGGCASVPRQALVGPPALPLALTIPGARPVPLRVTRIAHASVLLEFEGAALLTDPWFTETDEYPPSERLGRGADAMPPLTAVVSTMDHYDHFDVEGLKGSPVARAPLLVPRGTRQATQARAAGLKDVRELRPGESVTIGSFAVTAIRARPEGAAPDAFDFETSWLIEAGAWRVLVVGHRISPELAALVAPIDLVLVPVNNLRLKPLFKQLSMGPEEAAEVARAAGARVTIPTHFMYRSSWAWETFLLSHDGTTQAFSEAARLRGVTPVVLVAGQPLSISGSIAAP
jgi:L-ascorbate metabolism protein UlaG (beta-lactamase superfamily)